MSQKVLLDAIQEAVGQKDSEVDTGYPEAVVECLLRLLPKAALILVA